MLPYSASRGPAGAVEHSLGKGEVESSIPPGSGSKLIRDGTRSPIANLPTTKYITLRNENGRAMLTVREVEAAVAEMLKASPTAAAHYIRTLKEAEPPLWFRVGRGRTEAPLSANHLVNVVLAFVGGQPVEAPATVARLRALQVDYIRHPGPDGRQEYYGGLMQSPVDMCGVIICLTLGETLDRLAETGDENHQVGRVVFVEIQPEGAVQAWIRVATGSGTYSASFALMDTPITSGETEAKGGPLMISRTVTLWSPLFKRMAELLRASAPAPAGLPSSGPFSSASARPEDENAAPARAALPTRPVRLSGTEKRRKAIQKSHAEVGFFDGLRQPFT